MGSKKIPVHCSVCSTDFYIRKDSIKRSIEFHGIYKCRSCANKKPLFGVGINDADYPTTLCPYYIKWNSMLRRCYSTSEIQEAYTGVTVCDEWLIFSNFKKWMQSQTWIGLQIDKDIINIGNKLYAPENCCFVSGELNTAIQSSSKGYSIVNGKYKAKVKMFGNTLNLGEYTTAKEANSAYREAKVDYLKMFIQQITDSRIKQGLLNHIKELENVK